MIPPFVARNLTIPVSDGLRTRRKVLQELREAEKLQWLRRDEIIKHQWKYIEILIKEAYSWIPYYKKKFNEHGINITQLQSPEDIKKLPILTKKDINEHREEMVDPRYRSRVYKNMTGGSTGVPTRFYQVEKHWIKNTAATIKNYKWTGFNEGERVSIIWGHQLDISYLRSKKEKLKFFLSNKQLIPVLSLDHGSLKHSIQAIQNFKPQLIQGYNTYLYIFAQYVLENKIDVIRPKAVISSANTLFDFQRRVIEKAFHCKVYDRYGSRELGCIAGECSEGTGLHINMENVFVEFEKLKSFGVNEELFSLICTSLGNYGMPFIRYEIGDLGVPSKDSCPCGRGLPLIKKIKGRTHDILRSPSGKIITGDLFDIIFQHHAHLIRQFQIRQKRLDQMEVSVVVQPGIEQNDLQPIMSFMKKTIGSDVDILLKIKNKISTSGSGKLNLTISEL